MFHLFVIPEIFSTDLLLLFELLFFFVNFNFSHQVTFEGEHAGGNLNGDIAIDDVSFTPECRPAPHGRRISFVRLCPVVIDLSTGEFPHSINYEETGTSEGLWDRLGRRKMTNLSFFNVFKAPSFALVNSAS